MHLGFDSDGVTHSVPFRHKSHMDMNDRTPTVGASTSPTTALRLRKWRRQMNLEKEKYKELFQQYSREFVEHLYHAKGMKATQAQALRRYAAKKKETETTQDAAKCTEETV